MTDQDKELRMRISMLMDSELDGRDNPRLLDRLENDDALQETWARYSLIGDALRSDAGDFADRDFSRRISNVIANEPSILAPRPVRSVASVPPKVVSIGLAASLAAVVVLVGNSLSDHADFFHTASTDVPAAAQIAARGVEPGESGADSRFNDYLVMHNETAYMAGSAGMLSYVRLVGSGRDR